VVGSELVDRRLVGEQLVRRDVGGQRLEQRELEIGAAAGRAGSGAR
jgi:hypothetical protein